MTREEKDEKNQARLERINNKNDIALFRRQIMALPEYAAERLKIPALQKSSKMAVKLSAVIDTDALESGTDVKMLNGYIRQDVGDNTTNLYDLVYDRTQRKIVSVKRTQEAMDADKEANDEKEEKETAKKGHTTVKKAVKKNKDDDEDDDPDEEKPSKTKHGDNDDD